MEIHAIPAFSDNYIWQISAAVLVDPGDENAVAHLPCAPAQIWLTHRHRDHTGAAALLKKRFPGCAVYGSAVIAEVTETVGEGSVFSCAAGNVRVWAIPGHTDEHLAFLLDGKDGQLHVFCGDTLFSGGCGRAFDGSVEDLRASLARLDTLPENTLLYPAHEYTAANLRFAAVLEPQNREIQAALAAAHKTPTLPVTLAHERAVNPFLRFRLPEIRRRAADECGVDGNDDAAVFAALRAWKNRF